MISQRFSDGAKSCGNGSPNGWIQTVLSSRWSSASPGATRPTGGCADWAGATWSGTGSTVSRGCHAPGANHEQGAFDAGGKPPAIDDERVRWHVGDVQDTLGAVDLAAARDAQWLVLFDLDIYEPTAFAWEVISAHLRPGDVIYLDEAVDRDERRVLDEMILPSIGCEPVGTTALALGLVVTRPVR